MPPPTLEQKLIAQLRKAINDVAKQQKAIATTEEQVRTAQTARAAAGAEMIKAAGHRDALAVLFLPPGKTLTQAWDEDYKGLRTGGPP